MTGLAAAARARGVTRLVHFTPARNLPHILTAGAIRPVSDLAADTAATYAATDLSRLDGHPELTCCSIEYPNVYYLWFAKARAVLYPDWVGLLISVDLLDAGGVYLSPRNAAAGTARPATLGAFDGLYTDSIRGAGGATFRRGATHLASVPTDLQAEVLLPGAVPLSQVSGVMTPDRATADTVRAQLRQLQQAWPADWAWTSCPVAFEADRLRKAVWAGLAPTEEVL